MYLFLCLYRREKREEDNMSHLGLMILKGLLRFTITFPFKLEAIDQSCLVCEQEVKGYAIERPGEDVNKFFEKSYL